MILLGQLTLKSVKRIFICSEFFRNEPVKFRAGKIVHIGYLFYKNHRCFTCRRNIYQCNCWNTKMGILSEAQIVVDAVLLLNFSLYIPFNNIFCSHRGQPCSEKKKKDFFPFYWKGKAADLYFFYSEYINDFESQIK